MITTIRRLCTTLALFSIFIYSDAQELRTFNQNSSRSNNAHALSISVSPVYSGSLNSSSDSLLFRGSGGGFRVGADYFFGKAGISFSTGFGSSSSDDATINKFLKNFPVPPDQLIITKARQQNMYLLLGPSVRFGNTVELYAHAKAGLFINNSGLVNIQQKGAQRAAFRNESTDKNIYPGFLTGISLQYKTKSEVWSIGIGADYMNTRSEVNNYDMRRGNGIEALKLSRNIMDVVTGITVRYNIFSARDHASGQSTGRRLLPTVNKRELTSRDAQSGLSASRLLPTVNKKEIAIDEPGVQRTLQSCGPVTKKITNADGTTEEMTFSCPADAANYNDKMSSGGMPNRISMNVTTPRQTQGTTFGEKTFAAPHVLDQKGIISGRLTWTTPNTTGIITNAIINNSSPRSGSTTMNSQSSSTRTTNQSSFGTLIRLSARESGSGMATGKRSREAGSGLATGRRQYEPVFIENINDVCNPCIVDAKLSSIKNNPLYGDKGMTGENPLYESNKRTAGGGDDCDGIGNIDVYLLDANSEVIISKTKTEACGDFFFANMPEGDYVIKVSGSFISKKGYDVYLRSKIDLAGGVSQSSDGIQLLINTSNNNDGPAQKAGISTSRSNLRTKSVSIIEADLDGDGEFESLMATGVFSDGSSRDITNDVEAKKVNKIDAFTIKQGVMKMNSGNGSATATHLTGITIAKGDINLRAIATFSDGATQDVTEALVINTTHNNIKQYGIVIADLDGDGFADAVKITKSRSNIQNNRITADAIDENPAEAVVKTKTKSNQSNDRMASNVEENDIWSPRSNIKMMRVATGDVDGDGVPDFAAGNLSRETIKDHFQNGDIPSQNRPGSPIGGLAIKGGKNPGGNIAARSTNEDGEFEFTGLEPGDYTFTVEQRIFIEDETPVTIGSGTKAQDHNSSRSNKTASVVAGGPDNDNTKAQDHNSSRSNKTASIIENDPDVYWVTSKGGVTNTPVMKAQNNNTVRSNRTDNALIDISGSNDPDNIAIDESGLAKPKERSGIGPVKWMAPESMKMAVNSSHSNIKNLLAVLDQLDGQLDADHSSTRSGINTSRSNIKNQRVAIDDLQETLDNLQMKDKNVAMNELDQKTAAMNMQFLSLQKSLTKLGNQYTAVSNVLKSRHDAAMSSIRNMK